MATGITAEDINKIDPTKRVIPYQLSGVDYTEEAILNDRYPNPDEPIKGWRRFRINYRNEHGFSNVEGTLYFPPNIDPYPILDELVNKLYERNTKLSSGYL